MSMTTTLDARKTPQAILGVVTLWAVAVVIGAETGFFASLYLPLIAAIVAATIIAPTVLYFRSRRLRAYVEQLGHRPILLFHTWRIPAALMFLHFGLQDRLPPAFWILAGTGDLIAGSYAAYLMSRPESTRRYLSFHVFGFLDLVVAVGTGLTFTLLQDPRMAPVAVLPLALIPLFGVGISGATHLIAFDMLRRGVGMTGTALHAPAHRT